MSLGWSADDKGWGQMTKSGCNRLSVCAAEGELFPGSQEDSVQALPAQWHLGPTLPLSSPALGVIRGSTLMVEKTPVALCLLLLLLF